LKEVGQQYPGVIRAPEWKDGFDHAPQERTLADVGYRIAWCVLLTPSSGLPLEATVGGLLSRMLFGSSL
jgi:hypothetical protein